MVQQHHTRLVVKSFVKVHNHKFVIRLMTVRVQWLVGTKHFPESKTHPRIEKHVPESKALPRIQQHVPESKTLKLFRSRRQLPEKLNNPKPLFSRIEELYFSKEVKENALASEDKSCRP